MRLFSRVTTAVSFVLLTCGSALKLVTDKRRGNEGPTAGRRKLWTGVGESVVDRKGENRAVVARRDANARPVPVAASRQDRRTLARPLPKPEGYIELSFAGMEPGCGS